MILASGEKGGPSDLQNNTCANSHQNYIHITSLKDIGYSEQAIIETMPNTSAKISSCQIGFVSIGSCAPCDTIFGTILGLSSRTTNVTVICRKKFEVSNSKKQPEFLERKTSNRAYMNPMPPRPERQKLRTVSPCKRLSAKCKRSAQCNGVPMQSR